MSFQGPRLLTGIKPEWSVPDGVMMSELNSNSRFRPGGDT